MRKLVINLTGITGLASIGMGAWLLSPASAFLLVGSLLLIGAVFGALR